MDSNIQRDLGVVVAVIIVFIAGYATITACSGLESPFSNVTSQSMQHNDAQSQLGVIDTGDLVVVFSPDKTEIHSYVEGSVNGYKSFGDYGSVIIYERSNGNPVIHRAILWLEWDPETSKWSAPSLKDYEGEWYTSNGSSWDDLSGTLYFKDITVSKKYVSVNLNNLQRHSGYLTMGDNNPCFDQEGVSGAINDPIAKERIKSVAVFEIPWLGSIKLFVSEDTKFKQIYEIPILNIKISIPENLAYHAPNTIPSLIMFVLAVFSAITVTDIVYNVKENKRLRDKIEELEDDEE